MNKTTAGTLILDGTNAYTGTTKVTAGTLQLTSGVTIASTVFDVFGGTLDVTAFSPYNLPGGKRLQGNGTVLGSIDIAGTLAPGESPGQLTIAGSVGLSGSLAEEINSNAAGTGYDQLVVNDNGASVSNVTLSGLLALTVSGTYVPLGEPLWIINDTSATGTLTGTFGTVTGLPDGWQVLYRVTYDPLTPNLTEGSGNDVAILTVPEPAALLMLITAAGLGLLYKRRRNK